MGFRQPTVSHHLKIMTEAGLLDRERRGDVGPVLDQRGRPQGDSRHPGPGDLTAAHRAQERRCPARTPQRESVPGRRRHRQAVAAASAFSPSARPARYRSASSAAAHPEPAAVIA
ncbi:ArsR family transcriptional regulator [Streptomyces kunmingensis]|uniref:ArsR family transcriptional regulator n=1 Tax=Streptomyces kunmingensis TaxID=68225 RepID=UPI003983A746